ncbi:MAG TPA: transcriptional regulator, partial [Candidatus Merdenecus merdavium]|nr:transcriptional regulator [Candidatus Merdenecus merdavium]
VESNMDDLKVIAEKLEIINLQLAQRNATRQKILQGLLISLCAMIVIVFMVLISLNSPYLSWNYNDPELAVAGVAFHAFEWLFVRLAPLFLIGAILGMFLIKKKK